MKLMYDGKVVVEVMANHSMSIEDMLEYVPYDLTSQEGLEEAYNAGVAFVYYDEEYDYDYEGLSVEA